MNRTLGNPLGAGFLYIDIYIYIYIYKYIDNFVGILFVLFGVWLLLRPLRRTALFGGTGSLDVSITKLKITKNNDEKKKRNKIKKQTRKSRKRGNERETK